MINYSLAIEEFKILNIEDKKTKLLELINKFKNIDEIFIKLEYSINTHNYNDEVLLNVYTIIAKSMETVDKDGLNKNISRLQDLNKILENIHLMETQDRTKEGDPDIRLEQILNLIP